MTLPAPGIAFTPPVSELLPRAADPDRALDASLFEPLKRIGRRLRSDESLAAALQRGHADALTELFKRHSPLLFALARRIVRDRAETEDVVQQTFFDAYRSIHQYDPARGPFKTWLLLFAYHRAFNHLRSLQAGRFFLTCSLDDFTQLPAAAHSPAELRVVVDQALRALPARERQTIELIYYSGFTAIEVAAQTNQTARVVRHNLYRGLAKMRKALAADAPRSATSKNGDAR